MLITAALLYTEDAEYCLLFLPFFACAYNLTGLTVRTTYQRTYRKINQILYKRIVAKNHLQQQQQQH